MPPIFRVCFLALVFTLPAATHAAAQSFLENLFGFGASKQEQAQPLPPPMPSYRAPIHTPHSRTISHSDAETVPHISGIIRTVCVRTCDGYYFPISHATNARKLSADNARCKAKCGSDSRLFYSPGEGEPDMASMIDLTGRRYDELDTAFAYRKALRPGCGCRPPPWSSAERLRHFKYALEDAQSEVTQIAANDIKLDGKPNAFSRPAVESNDDAGEAAADHQVVQAQGEPRPSRERTAALSQHQHEEGYRRPASAASRPARPARERSSNTGNFSSLGLGGIFSFGQQKQNKQVWPGD